MPDCVDANEPSGELVLQNVAMPADANMNGDIFGGWLVSQMDLGGTVIAGNRSRSRVVTVAIDQLVFKEPVYVGDTVCCYAEITREGRTSMTVNIQVWSMNLQSNDKRKVTEAVFTYVAIDQHGKPQRIDR